MEQPAEPSEVIPPEQDTVAVVVVTSLWLPAETVGGVVQVTASAVVIATL